MNMNYGRYFIPNFGMRSVMPFTPFNGMMPRNTGLLNRMFSSLKGFNWKGLLSGANKTLNVMNQTIPLIRQATPMVNNVKSMVKLAKAFGSETTSKRSISTYSGSINNKKIANENKNYTSNNDYPTFFV